jgi:Family of unknown function (DUF5724)/Domain of unknown function (DUF4132)
VLTAEDAAARLDGLRDAQWRTRALDRIQGLRPWLHGPARTFLSVRPASWGTGTVRKFQDDRDAAARRLDELTSGQLASVMAALHPGLGSALARWWTDAQGRPYQRGWTRKAFRCPGSPEVSAQARGNDLARLVDLLGPFDADPVWLAGWGGHLAMRSGLGGTVGSVLASAVDLGGRDGEETLAALIEVGHGEHPVGIMGQHVIAGLLGAARPEGWAFTERLLLAAQRQEGLRQAILEAADEGHPEAFDRILTIVLEHKLLRFAAAVRAAGVWLGFGATVADIPRVEARVRAFAVFRADPAGRAQALAGGDGWDAYLALCAQGTRDVLVTVPEARTLARHLDPDVRAAALRYAAATELTAGQQLLATALDDEDLRVAALAASLLTEAGRALPGAFGALTRLIPRLPATSRTADPLGVETAPVTMSRAATAGQLARADPSRPAGDLLPWLPAMDAAGRSAVLARIAREDELTADLRPVVVKLLGDRSPSVRQAALAVLTRARLAASEAPAVEALLSRGAADLRRGALSLLASLPPEAARISAARLAASADTRQREAGAELLRTTGDAPPGEQAGDPGPVQADARARTTPRTPQAPKRRRGSGREQATGILEALDELAAEHRDTLVQFSSWQGSKQMLFGDIAWFPVPFGPASPHLDGPAPEAAMVLGEVFRDWWQTRQAGLRGPDGDDGLDAMRAYVTAQLAQGERHAEATPGLAGRGDWWQSGLRELAGRFPGRLRYPAAVLHAAGWLAAEHATGQVVGECLDALEWTLARVPRSELTAPRQPEQARYEAALGSFRYGHLQAPGTLSRDDWRRGLASHPWLGMLRGLLRTQPALFSPEQIARWYRLMRWTEQPYPGAPPLPPDDRLLAAAHAIGAACDDDVIAAFLQPRNMLFRDLTRHWRGQLEARHPRLTVIADQLRERLIAAELRRGDLPTPTSRAVTNISSSSGAELVTRLLAGLGRTPLARGYTRGSDSRDGVFSQLIRTCLPAAADTPDTLTAAARQAGLPDSRLVDLAVYAPQWAPLAEQALGWPGLTGGVLWLHAHTKDGQWSVEAEIRESWAAMAAERTPLSAADLVSGAVDVAWFQASHAALGAERWAVLHKAAKLASGGNGHRRAQVFAEAMLGQLDEDTLTTRIRAKRNQDAVRAFGLLPLPAGRPDRASADRDSAVQRRYAMLREFERGSAKFGSQRQASERAAVRIGVENLARTAGYADPLRFTWAVEAREAADLAAGPVTVTHGDVTVALSVTGDGTPDLTVRKGQRVLRAVPAALRQAEDVAGLRARKTALTQQAVRVRAALEAAMVAQDTFTAADLAELAGHPLVAPMLRTLVWVDEAGRTSQLAAGGTPLAAGGQLRVAHPADLVAEGSWVAWQERLFAGQCRQPFKQVFRELYVRTAAERDTPVSRRYEGHQLQPRQALALFGRRGWVASREDGVVLRAFHHCGLIARVEFSDGFLTPMEADLPAVAGVYFTRHGEYLAQPLDAVPPVVFSEAMRDLDLVVSVAHAGGVDPEATASTAEMRAALVRETARLMKLANVRVTGVHVLVEGTLGEYSVHLGSGTVHRRPGGAVCIVPVGSQHRGRLFLPFADDDPKTAEIVSKVLLLARDHQIKDPAILGQLTSA